MKYAGFWKRFAASWIDALVLMLPLIFLLWLESVSRSFAFVALFPLTYLFPAYEVYFHGRSGQTLGKRGQGITVVSLDGAPITWKQAFMRSSVGLGLGILASMSTFVALFNITDAEFSALDWSALSARKAELSPYINQITLLSLVWTWSEVIVLLFNRKRRALHDFIAGTVVVENAQPMQRMPPAS